MISRFLCFSLPLPLAPSSPPFTIPCFVTSLKAPAGAPVSQPAPASPVPSLPLNNTLAPSPGQVPRTTPPVHQSRFGPPPTLSQFPPRQAPPQIPSQRLAQDGRTSQQVWSLAMHVAFELRFNMRHFQRFFSILRFCHETIHLTCALFHTTMC